MTDEKASTDQKSCHSKFPWTSWPKEGCYACVGRFFANPYTTNKFSNDMMTETALNLAHWKRENVFPVDLKLRAPAVLFSVMLALKSWFISL